MPTRSFTVQLEDEPDVEVEVEFDVTSWGAPETGPSYYSGGEPAEPPEWEILAVRRDDDGADILSLLSDDQLKEIDDEIANHIDEYADDGPDYEPDYD